MKYILSFFEYTKYGKVFGYAAREMTSNKIRYFTHLDKIGKYHPEYVEEIFLDKPKYYYYQHMPVVFESLPTLDQEYVKIIQDIKDIIANEHIKFNKANGLPTEYLEENSKSMLIFPSSLNSNCVYTVPNNICLLSIPIFLSSNFKDANNGFIEFVTSNFKDINNSFLEHSLYHEIGHAKASHTNVDMQNGTIDSYLGVNHIKSTFRSYELPNNEVLLVLEKTKRSSKNNQCYILEEMLNERELSLMLSDYIFGYPRYGEILNALCNYKLEQARYMENGLDIYYDEMNKIIHSSMMADELLCNLYASIMDDIAFHKIGYGEEAQRILKKYCQKKFGDNGYNGV